MDGKKRYSRVAMGVGAFLYVGNLLAVVLYTVLPENAWNNTWLAWTLQDFANVVAVGVAWLIVHRVPTVKREKKKMGILDFLLTLGVVETVSMVSAMLIVLVSMALGIQNGTTVVDEIVGNDLWVQLVFVCVTGPILEEILCRKLIIDKLRDAGERRAVLFSALFFALMHGNVYQCAYAFPVGLILAYVYLRTNNILYTIALHMLLNFLGVVSIPYVTTLGIYATLCMFFLRKPRIYFEDPAEKTPLKNALLNGGMVFASIIIVLQFIAMAMRY